MTRLVTTIEEFTQAKSEAIAHRRLPQDEERRRNHFAVVMTMGALHDGHGALMEAARHLVGPDGVVIVTIFVNPTQFLAGEDFEKYPRTLDEDFNMCLRHGVDIVFAPQAYEIYQDDVPTLSAGALGTVLEGQIRPGHFDGVCTVVNRMLRLVDAGIAVFGEKDYQQLVIIRAMVRDQDLPVTIVGVPTIRESDGLAMSSRNRYLNAQERELARALSIALDAGRKSAVDGVDAVLVATEATLAAYGVEPDYVTVTDVDLGPAPDLGEARLLVAARIGQTRLIDNCEVQLGYGRR